MGKEITISSSSINGLIATYIAIPFFIFIIGWLKLPLASLLAVGLLFLLRATICVENNTNKKNQVHISGSNLLLLLLLVVLLGWLVGFGGYFYQTWDNHYRNAIFRDLITHDWPVFYESDGSALVYYIGQWMFPALVGKFLGWEAANMVLFIWNCLGIVLLLLTISVNLRKTSSMNIISIFSILVFWGGLHLLGTWLGNVISPIKYGFMGTGDGWTGMLIVPGYQYSANLTVLQWVYNQGIVPWLVCSIVFFSRNIQVLGFYCFCSLLFAPLPFIGFFVVLCPYVIVNLSLAKLEHRSSEYLKQLFSVVNVGSFLFICIPLVLYYFSNSVSNSEQGITGFGWYVPPEDFLNIDRLGTYLIFCLLEFGIFGLILFPVYKKSILFKISLFSLFIYPLFRIGISADFCMRASIPALFILMLYAMRYLLEGDIERFTSRKCILIITITIAGYNVVGGLGLCLQDMIGKNKFPYRADDVGTLENYPLGKMGDKLGFLPNFNFNFTSSVPEEKFFFRYLAK